MSFKKEVMYSMGVFALLAIISIIRQIWLHQQNFILNPIQAVTIFMVYIFCLNVWWKGIKKRVVSDSVKYYLTMEHWSMVSGLMVRLGQSCITVGVDIYGRITGYFFLIPAILVALFGFYAAYMLGKPRNAKLPARLKMLMLPTIICIALILTNDFHQLIFRKVEDEARSGVNAVFEPTSFFIAIFFMLAVLEFAKIYLVFLHGRKIRNHFYRWLPTIISCGFIAFTIPYAVTGFAVPKFELLEYYVGMLFLECLLWESLIAIGALPVNTHYQDMFRHSSMGMLILKTDGSLYRKSDGAKDISRDQFEKLKRENMIITHDGLELHISEINAGYVVWQRDTKELRDKLHELHEKRDALQTEDEILRAELANRSEQEKLAARKHLYKMINEQTKEDNDKILELLGEIHDGKGDRNLLRQAVEYAQKVKNTGIYLMEQTGGDPL